MGRDCLSWSCLVDRYERERKPRPKTADNMRRIVDLFARDTGIASPHGVSREKILDWRDQVLDRASIQTWNTYHRHLRALFSAGVEAEILDHNPWKTVRSLTTHHKRKKTVSLDLLQRSIDLLRRPDNRLIPGWFWIVALKTLFHTGMRRRQLVALRWPHIDLERGIMLLAAEGSKTRREWMIPIAEPLHDPLDQLRRQTIDVAGDEYLLHGQAFNVTLFYRRYKGHEMSEEQLSGFFRRLSGELSRETGETVRITPHRLRHTMATMLAPQGDIKSLQHMLGHTDIRTTLEYVNPELETMRRLAEKLPAIDTAGNFDAETRPGS